MRSQLTYLFLIRYSSFQKIQKLYKQQLQQNPPFNNNQLIISLIISIKSSRQIPPISDDTFLMNTSLITCTSCHKQIERKGPSHQRIKSLNSFYCCSYKQFFCKACSQIMCKVCKQTRKNLHKETSQSVIAQYKFAICHTCPTKQQKILKLCFFEQKCKMYYCGRCIHHFYKQYIDCLQMYSKSQGNNIQMDVELPCRCEVPQQKIQRFISIICLICWKNIQDKSVKLKYGMRVEQKCFNKLRNSLQNSCQKQEKYKQIITKFTQIYCLMVYCGICEGKVDGKVSCEWNQVDNVIVCASCLWMSNQKENQMKCNRMETDSNKEKQYEIKLNFHLEKEKQQQIKVEQINNQIGEQKKEKSSNYQKFLGKALAKIQEQQKQMKNSKKLLSLHQKKILSRSKNYQSSSQGQIRRQKMLKSNQQQANNKSKTYFSEGSTHQKQSQQGKNQKPEAVSSKLNSQQLEQILQQDDKPSVVIATGLQQFKPAQFQLQFTEVESQLTQKQCGTCNISISIIHLLFILKLKEDPKKEITRTIFQLDEVLLKTNYIYDRSICKYCLLKIKMSAKRQQEVLKQKDKLAEKISKRFKNELLQTNFLEAKRLEMNINIKPARRYGPSISILKKSHLDQQNKLIVQGRMKTEQINKIKSISDLVESKLNGRQFHCKKCNTIQSMDESNALQLLCTRCKEDKGKNIQLQINTEPLHQIKNDKQAQKSPLELQNAIQKEGESTQCSICPNKINSEDYLVKMCMNCKLKNDSSIFKKFQDCIKPKQLCWMYKQQEIRMQFGQLNKICPVCMIKLSKKYKNN